MCKRLCGCRCGMDVISIWFIYGLRVWFLLCSFFYHIFFLVCFFGEGSAFF